MLERFERWIQRLPLPLQRIPPTKDESGQPMCAITPTTASFILIGENRERTSHYGRKKSSLTPTDKHLWKSKKSQGQT